MSQDFFTRTMIRLRPYASLLLVVMLTVVFFATITPLTLYGD